MAGVRPVCMVCRRGRDPVPILYEARWAPGPFWTVAENLASTGIRSLDRPARKDRLRYSDPLDNLYLKM
jgi:hypothetical protein